MHREQRNTRAVGCQFQGRQLHRLKKVIRLLDVLPRRNRVKILQESRKAPTEAGALSGLSCSNSLFLRRCGLVLGVFAAEALDASGGIHELLLAGEKWMAGRAYFNADIAFVSRPRHKCISARAVHANFVISGMNGCFHRV